MKLLGIYKSLLKEEGSDIMTADEIADYISEITPNKSDLPDYFIDQIKKSGKVFKKEKLNIEDLLKKDSDLAEYVESGVERYGDDDYTPNIEDLDYPIVVFNGEVVDGYSRVSYHYHNGEDFIYGYVSQ
jgi:hypothetical protein